jgi:uncharacterized protein YjiS (DUF1127 family)
MTGIGRTTLTNYQVTILWPTRRRRGPGAFARAWSLLQRWRLRIRQRAELAQLGERDLRDLGLSQSDTSHELGKWFWQE